MTSPTTNTKQQWIRVVGLCVIGFLVMVTYAIARPAIKSLFLKEYGSRNLPYAWIAIAIAVTLVVSWYNRMVVRHPLMRMFAGTILISSLTLLLFLVAAWLGSKPSIFILYVWKDVYVIILVEIFWSFSNLVFPIHVARWAYGLFCMMGSLGGLAGHLIIGPLSYWVSTIHTLWFLFPVFASIWGISIYFSQQVGETKITLAASKQTNLRDGLRVIQQSRYLLLLLLLVATVQIVVTLVDFQYSRSLEVHYIDTNQRTEVIGQVFAMINLVSLFFELLTGPILRMLGVPIALLSIPMLLIASLGAIAVWPRFLTVVVAQIVSKSTTYSLFKAAKEILYIPLNYQEKTQGKAMIDMLTYRLAKGVASILILLLSAWYVFPTFGGEGIWVIETLLLFFRTFHTSPSLLLTMLVLTLLWFVLTLSIVRRYRQQVSREEEFQRSP